MQDQSIKSDNGKEKISLVPMQIVRDISRVREYGIQKYNAKESWKEVEVERYINALMRHALLFSEDPYGMDAESGLPHLWHLECNCAFLSELMRGDLDRAELIKETEDRLELLKRGLFG